MNFNDQTKEHTFLTENKNTHFILSKDTHMNSDHAKEVNKILKFVEEVKEKKDKLLSITTYQFFTSFKVVIEKMLDEFQALQKKFDDYANYYENEA